MTKKKDNGIQESGTLEMQGNLIHVLFFFYSYSSEKVSNFTWNKSIFQRSLIYLFFPDRASKKANYHILS